MVKPIMIVLLLATLAVWVRTDRDGRLGHGDVVARIVGLEVRLELTVARPASRCVETKRVQTAAMGAADSVEVIVVCE